MAWLVPVKALLVQSWQKTCICTSSTWTALIEEDQSAPLQQVLESHGVPGFRKLEEKVILTMQQQNHVIATGGSAIYSEAGMAHLKQFSLFLFYWMFLCRFYNNVWVISAVEVL